MKKLWFCIASVLSVAGVVCDIRVFPAENQSVAGVFQVGLLSGLDQLQYAFNASEARRMCAALGVTIASKAQVTEALHRGLETCRFGWTDENLAVIPRNKALVGCGQNKTGLVTWRASAGQKFDVFCFNETDAAAQMRTTTDSPLSSSAFSEHTDSPPTTASLTESMPSSSSSSSSSSSFSPSPSSSSSHVDAEVESSLFVGGTKGSFGAEAILITSACVLLLVAIIILVFIKLRSNTMSADIKQPEKESIQTEEWTCVKNTQETRTVAQDERIEVDDACQTDV